MLVRIMAGDCTVSVIRITFDCQADRQLEWRGHRVSTRWRCGSSTASEIEVDVGAGRPS
jgi:hypothetical protein